MNAVEQHVADIRGLVRWWIVGFAAMASTAIGGMSILRTDVLRPWARALWLLLVVACFAVATAVLLGVAHVFRLPKDWSELSQADRDSSGDFGAGPEQLAVWDRSTIDRHRAEEVRQRVVAAVRLRECDDALQRVTRRLRVAALVVLLLVVGLVTVREGGRLRGPTCEDSLVACRAVPVTAAVRVTVMLAADDRGDVSDARDVLAARLGGTGCSPPARFDAVAVGGDLIRPVVVAEFPRCAGRRFLVDPPVGVALPAQLGVARVQPAVGSSPVR